MADGANAPGWPEQPVERVSGPEPSTLSIAAIERSLEERLDRLRAGLDEHLDAPGRLRFWMDGHQYSAELSTLREALPALPPATPLPFSPRWLLGICPLRTDLIALVDLWAYLRDVQASPAPAQVEAREIEQALLIGEAGHLIAFSIDRIGEISNEGEPLAGANRATGEIAPARYVERVYPPDHPGGEPIIALHLARVYADVVARLEEWSRDV